MHERWWVWLVVLAVLNAVLFYYMLAIKPKARLAQLNAPKGSSAYAMPRGPTRLPEAVREHFPRISTVRIRKPSEPLPDLRRLRNIDELWIESSRVEQIDLRGGSGPAFDEAEHNMSIYVAAGSTLDFRGTQLSYIDQRTSTGPLLLDGCTNLRHLEMGSRAPEDITGWESLTSLHWLHCGTTDAFPSLPAPENLRVLVLGSFPPNEVPWAKLSGLTTVYLSGERPADVPWDELPVLNEIRIPAWPELGRLDLRRHPLSSLFLQGGYSGTIVLQTSGMYVISLTGATDSLLRFEGGAAPVKLAFQDCQLADIPEGLDLSTLGTVLINNSTLGPEAWETLSRCPKIHRIWCSPGRQSPAVALPAEAWHAIEKMPALKEFDQQNIVPPSFDRHPGMRRLF